MPASSSTTRIAQVTADTIKAAREVEAVAKKLIDEQQCAAEPAGEQCGGLALFLNLSLGSLISALDSWRPYL